MRYSFEVANLIHYIRGCRVMLSGDLARLYEVPPKALIQAVKRNRERFPTDFCFQLLRKEDVEVTDRDFKLGRAAQSLPIRIYGAGRRDALKRSAQQNGDQSQHFYHAGVCKDSRVAGPKPRNYSKAWRTRDTRQSARP